MEAQRTRARAAQKKEVIAVSQIETDHADAICGFDTTLQAEARVLEVVRIKDRRR
jgi:hypothetical protein